MADSESASESPPTASAEGAEPSFEAALERLESVVDRLEQGDLELETALASFEEGVRLVRDCAARLEVAERRVEILVREGEQWVARPFDEPSGDEGAPAASDADAAEAD